jgi:hypothetical protein
MDERPLSERGKSVGDKEEEVLARRSVFIRSYSRGRRRSETDQMGRACGILPENPLCRGKIHRLARRSRGSLGDQLRPR